MDCFLFFFFQGCENPKETTKGESVHFLEPPSAAWCAAVSHRCTHQWVGLESGSIRLLLILGTGKTGTESAGDGIAEGHWWGWGLSPPWTMYSAEKETVLPWRAAMLGSCFPGVSTAAISKGSFPRLAIKGSHYGSAARGAETGLCWLSLLHTMYRGWSGSLLVKISFVSQLWWTYSQGWYETLHGYCSIYHSITAGFYLTHASSSKPFSLSFRTRWTHTQLL